MRLYRHQRGFTLIELLTVIAIIGILASIIMVSLSSAKSKSRDSRRQADLKSIQLALSLYYNDNGMYPMNMYGTGSTVPTNKGLSPTYLPTVPTDPFVSVTPAACASSPTTNGCYNYVAMGLGAAGINCNGYANPANPLPSYYHLGAVLEDPTNVILTQDVDTVPSSFGACSASNGGTDFNGTSIGVNGRCSAIAGAPQPGGTETCLDWAP